MDRAIYQFGSLQHRAHSGQAPFADQARRAGGDTPLVGVVYNPRSHRNRGRDLECVGAPNVLLAQPETREELPHALAEFAQRGIDYLVINGGDGTVRDVLTCGAPAFGDNWPDLAVLPKGKTNALNVDLGAPAGWNIADALAAYDTGRRVERRALKVSDTGRGEVPIYGFILGAGAFAAGIRAGQDAHRMGAFNSLAVGVTVAWGVVQFLFGGEDNEWRRGVPMRILLGREQRELPHSGHGESDRRGLLLASTLGRFPFGMKPFGKLGPGLKLAVMDRPRRRLMGALPAILTGIEREWMPRSGFHQCAAERIELAIGDMFILDGEAFPAGDYVIEEGPQLRFVVP